MAFYQTKFGYYAKQSILLITPVKVGFNTNIVLLNMYNT